MKRFLLILLVLSVGPIYAQTTADFSTRAKSGQLTLDECLDLWADGRQAEAIPSLLVLKEQYERATPFDDAMYFEVVMPLHNYYIGTGDWVSSHKIVSNAIGVYIQRSEYFNSEYTRIIWCSMGELEGLLKNYDQAIRYQLQAQYMYEEANDYGETYMITLMNIAMSYLSIKDLLSAKIYMDEAKELFENLHGDMLSISEEEHFLAVANYGYLAYLTKHYAEAETYFNYVIDNCKRTAQSHDAYVLACNNLSAMYMEQGRWSESARLLEDIKSNNDEYNYVFAQNLALSHFVLGNYENAATELQRTNHYSLSNIENIFGYFSGRERENYWATISNERIFLNNLIAYKTQHGKAIETAYDNALFCKNLLLNTSKIIETYITNYGDRNLQQTFANYKALRQQLAYKTNSQASRDSITWNLVEHERLILSSLNNFSQHLNNSIATWKDVQASLGPDEIAIEFCYVPLMEKYPDVQTYYGAFILRHDDKAPQLIILETDEHIEDALANNSNELAINNLYSEANRQELHNLIWSKLTPHLQNIKTIYYAPTSLLSNLNFDVLCDANGTMLNEKYNMVRLSSTAQIENSKKSLSDSYSTAILYGNIKYDNTIEEMTLESSGYENFSGTSISEELTLRSENERGRLRALPFTKTEIDNASATLGKNGVSVTKLEGGKANEESFKALSGNAPDLLHLATHGFVIDSPQKTQQNNFAASTNAYSKKEAYLMWSGVLLAGANNVWQGNFNADNIEDGVLTADEISRLDLSNTKLVVLSACETARGKIDPIDGVYGLQRAFKMAGVQTIVMSLWKVQDDATAMLMTQFYTYLTNGTEKHLALWKAMMDVRGQYKDPYYWAGFIILD